MNRRILPTLIVTLILTLSSQSAHAEIQFKWLGICAFTLTDGKTTLLFDPAVTRPRFNQVLFNHHFKTDPLWVRSKIQKWKVGPIDGVFVSHTHSDHAIDAGSFIKTLGGVLYGSESTLILGKGLGLSDAQMKSMPVGSEVKVGQFKVKSFASPHPPIILPFIHFASNPMPNPFPLDPVIRDFKVGESVSFSIEHPEGKFFFQQTSQIPSPDPAAGVKANVLFQGIANRSGNTEIIEKRVLALGALEVIPLHFDNFFADIPDNDEALDTLPFVAMESFEKALKKAAPQVKFTVPQYGKPIKLK